VELYKPSRQAVELLQWRIRSSKDLYHHRTTEGCSRGLFESNIPVFVCRDQEYNEKPHLLKEISSTTGRIRNPAQWKLILKIFVPYRLIFCSLVSLCPPLPNFVREGVSCVIIMVAF
jgi:hypothetical protein